MNCTGLYRHVPSYMLLLPPSCLKVHGWVGGLQDFSVSPSPLGPNWVFELGWTGLGIRFGDMAWQYGIFVFLEWFNCQGNSGLSISIVSLQSDSKDSILVLWSTQYRPYLRVHSWRFLNFSRSYQAVREDPELDNIFLAVLLRSVSLPFLVSALLRFWKGSYWLNHDAYNFFSVPCALLNMFLVDLMRSALLSLTLSTYSIWLAERA